jgi:hypothetical protein
MWTLCASLALARCARLRNFYMYLYRHVYIHIYMYLSDDPLFFC